MKKILTIFTVLFAFSCSSNRSVNVQDNRIEKDNDTIEIKVVLPKPSKLKKDAMELFANFESKINKTISELEMVSKNSKMKSALYTSYQVYNNSKLGITSIIINSEKHSGGANPELTVEVINLDKDNYSVDLTKYVTEEVKQSILKQLKEKEYEADLSNAKYFFKDNKMYALFAPETVAARSEGQIEIEAKNLHQ